ncbi:MAG: TfoX/Sxy family protein [Gammaproteobacteria bacterium]|nr:TfoX/Sxy family protein [Gammaproteobacteria bacterium]
MSEFVNYLEVVFRDLGTITSRQMFGGYGLYHQGLMFALVADDQLYLKTDKTIEKYFNEKSLPAFEYKKGNKTVTMSYFLAPDEIMDNAELAATWGSRSFEAAKRNYKPKTKTKSV